MSGHSKWSTIKHKKGALDAKRGKLFSQLAKNIRIAVKAGKSGDPDNNAALRLAVDKAKAANMPKDNIQRAIDRGLGKGKGGAIEEIVYEAYGPGGMGMLIVALTDNKQRTGGDIRNIVSKAGGSLGGPGSAMYMFELQDDSSYKATIPMPIADEKIKIELLNLAETLREHDDVEDVYFASSELGEDN